MDDSCFITFISSFYLSLQVNDYIKEVGGGCRKNNVESCVWGCVKNIKCVQVSIKCKGESIEP